MIEDIALLTGQALDDEIAYIARSDVRWAAELVIADRASLQTGHITSADELGDLHSIFGNLDDIYAKDEVGLDTFLIRHVHPVLLDQRCGDERSRTKIKAIEAGLQDGSIKPNITIEGNMVIDGNKTAAAYHHIHSEDKAIDLPVYIFARK
jgi:hypothetical protein